MQDSPAVSRRSLLTGSGAAALSGSLALSATFAESAAAAPGRTPDPASSSSISKGSRRMRPTYHNGLASTALTTGLALQRHDTLLPGPRLFHWAAHLGPAVDTAVVAHPMLRGLAEESGETIGLIQFHAARTPHRTHPNRPASPRKRSPNHTGARMGERRG